MSQLHKSPVLRVLLGLAAGLTLGLLAPDSLAVKLVEPIGQLWVNGLRMTIVPLIAALLIVAVAGGERGATGKLGARAFAVFAALAIVVAIIAAFVTPHLWGGLKLDPADTAALLANSTALPEGAALTPRDWLLSLVPANIIKAAADGAILPLLVFTLIFAAALGRLPDAVAAPVIGFFKGLGDAMMIVVGWVLMLAPIGVFGLGAVVGAKLGGAAAAALLLFFAVSIIAYSVLTLVLYPLAPLGGVSIGRFARGILPAQLVAFASRSSLASLPSMLTAARGPLGVSEPVSAFVLPLAAATFKLQGAVSLLLGVTFVATLYGIPLGPAAIALAAGYGVLLALSTPGITSAGLLMQVPLFEALGLPVEGLALLIAIDTIPDIFKTVANVTADLLAAVLLDRSKA